MNYSVWQSCYRLTCECLETQCRSTFRTLLVAALRMMNSLSQVFSAELKPRPRGERHCRKDISTQWAVYLQPPTLWAVPTLGAAVSSCCCGDGERWGRRHGGPRVLAWEREDPGQFIYQLWFHFHLSQTGVRTDTKNTHKSRQYLKQKTNDNVQVREKA